MPKLILHVGTHKTGSTTLQRLLARHRDVLRSNGIVYPDSSSFLGGNRKAHHAFAKALSQPRSDQEVKAQQFAHHLYAQMSEHETAILSAESMWRHLRGARTLADLPSKDPSAFWSRRRAYLETVANLLSLFDIEVLVFLRRQDRFVESSYSEVVGRRMVQESFLSWRRERQSLADYTRQIQLFQSVFPRVTVFRYEDSGGRTEHTFQNHLGLDVLPDAPSARRSPDARVILWMRMSRPGNWKQRLAFGSSAHAVNLFEDYGRSTLWPCLQQRLEYNSQFEGPYGTQFFAPPEHNGRVAVLDEPTASSISTAWQTWVTRQTEDN